MSNIDCSQIYCSILYYYCSFPIVVHRVQALCTLYNRLRTASVQRTIAFSSSLRAHCMQRKDNQRIYYINNQRIYSETDLFEVPNGSVPCHVTRVKFTRRCQCTRPGSPHITANSPLRGIPSSLRSLNG